MSFRTVGLWISLLSGSPVIMHLVWFFRFACWMSLLKWMITLLDGEFFQLHLLIIFLIPLHWYYHCSDTNICIFNLYFFHLFTTALIWTLLSFYHVQSIILLLRSHQMQFPERFGNYKLVEWNAEPQRKLYVLFCIPLLLFLLLY